MESIYGTKRDLLVMAVMVLLLVAAFLGSPGEASAQTSASTDQYSDASTDQYANASTDQYQEGGDQTLPVAPHDPAYPDLANQQQPQTEQPQPEQPQTEASQTEASHTEAPQVAVAPHVSGPSGSDVQAEIGFYQAAVATLQYIIPQLQQSQVDPSGGALTPGAAPGGDGCDVYSFGREVPDPATGTCYEPPDSVVIGGGSQPDPATSSQFTIGPPDRQSNPTLLSALFGGLSNAVTSSLGSCSIIVDDCGDNDGDGATVTDAHAGQFDTDPTDRDADGSTFRDQDEFDPNEE